MSDDRIQHGWTAQGRGAAFDRQRRRRHGLGRLGTETERLYIERHLAGPLVLDVGAGTGRLTLAVAGRDERRVVALDASLSMLTRLRGNGPGRSGLAGLVAGICGDELPFRPESFDDAYCFGLLPFYRDWLPLVASLARVLRPGGRLLFHHQCRQADRIMGRQVPADRGRVDLETLQADLAATGLELAGCFPGAFFLNPMFIRAWAGPEASFRRVVTGHMAFYPVLVELIGRYPEVIEPWARLELILGAALPPAASRRVVVIARKPGDGDDDPSGAGPELFPGPAVIRERFEAAWRETEVPELVGSPGVIELLVLLDPLVRDLAGGEHPWARRIPGYEDKLARAAELMSGYTRPGPKMWLRGYFDRSRLGRSLSRRWNAWRAGLHDTRGGE